MASVLRTPLQSILKSRGRSSEGWRGSCSTLNLGACSPRRMRAGVGGGSTGNLALVGMMAASPTVPNRRRVNFFHIDEVREFARDSTPTTPGQASIYSVAGRSEESFSYQDGCDGGGCMNSPVVTVVPESDDEVEEEDQRGLYFSSSFFHGNEVTDSPGQEEGGASALPHIYPKVTVRSSGTGEQQQRWTASPTPGTSKQVTSKLKAKDISFGKFGSQIMTSKCSRAQRQGAGWKPTATTTTQTSPMMRMVVARDVGTSDVGLNCTLDNCSPEGSTVARAEGVTAMTAYPNFPPSSPSISPSRVVTSDMSLSSTPTGNLLFRTPVRRTSGRSSSTPLEEEYLPGSAVARYFLRDENEDELQSLLDISDITSVSSFDGEADNEADQSEDVEEMSSQSEEEEELFENSEVPSEPNADNESQPTTVEVSSNYGVATTPNPHDIILCDETSYEEDTASSVDSTSSFSDEAEDTPTPNNPTSGVGQGPSIRSQPAPAATNPNSFLESSSTSTLSRSQFILETSSQVASSSPPSQASHTSALTEAPCSGSAAYQNVNSLLKSIPNKSGDIYAYIAFKSSLIPELCKLSDPEWESISTKFGQHFSPVYVETVIISREYSKHLSRFPSLFSNPSSRVGSTNTSASS